MFKFVLFALVLLACAQRIFVDAADLGTGAPCEGSNSPCPRGEYCSNRAASSGGVCTKVTANSYAIYDGADGTPPAGDTLVTCLSPRTSAAGSDAITDCLCPDNTYGDKANGACTSCGNGGTAAAQTESGVATTVADCSCLANSYRGAAACELCVSPRTSAAGSGAITDCKCPVEFYATNGLNDNTGTCTACSANSASCKSSSERIAAGTCDPGYTSSDNGVTCNSCGTDEYKILAGNGVCATCSANSASCKAQLSGARISAGTCDPGYTSPDIGVTCNPCGTDEYKILADNGACATCSANSASCKAQLSGTRISAGTCDAGYSSTDGVVCTDCASGKYKIAAGNTACATCSANSASCNAQLSGARISAGTCDAGYGSSNAGVTCDICGIGTFKNAAGNVACESCDVPASTGNNGFTGYTTAVTGATSRGQCLICAAGYAGPAGGATYSGSVLSGCTKCAIGTYAVVNSTTCTPCATGSYAAAGAGVCTACPAAFSTSGVTSGTVGNVTDCKVCAAGYYGSNTGTLIGVSGCEACAAGAYSAINSKTCTACAAGTYSAGTAAGSCLSCATGKYSVTGSSVCTDCKKGYSTSTAGKGFCDTCATGYVGASTDGLTGCKEQSAAAGREDYGSTNMGTAVVIAIFAILLVVAFGVFCIRDQSTDKATGKGEFQMVAKV